MVNSNWTFIPQPLPVHICMIPELLESDSANIKERIMMVVNEERTIIEQCNIVSRSNWKNIHQGLEWWDCQGEPIKYLINCVASKKAY